MAGRRRKRARKSPRAVVAAAAATLAGLAAIFFSARLAGEELNRLPPSGDEVAMRLALLQAQLPNHRLTPAEVEAARTYALGAPLAYQPYFIAARAAEQSGRLDEATRLMEEARRRRPSFTAARVMLMGYYARAGRYGEAIAEADVAMRLSGRVQQAVLPILADMLPHAEARRAIAANLAEEPAWRAAFLEAAEAKAAPEHAAALLAELRRLKPAEATVPEASMVVAALVRAGRYGAAREAWLPLAPAEERSRGGLVFDGDFRGVEAPPPFGWTYHAGTAGRSEPARPAAGEPPHLAASYFGGAEALLAEQTLVLPPGRYRLGVLARADREELSGEVMWRLTCLGSGTEIGRLPLPRYREAFAQYAATVTVPSGCAAQKLSLVGRPGDLSQPINVDFARLRVERPAGGAP